MRQQSWKQALFPHPNSHPISLGQADTLPSSKPGVLSLLHPRTIAVICVPGLRCMGPQNPLGEFCCSGPAQSCICKNEDGQQRVHGAHHVPPSQRSSPSLAEKAPQFLIDQWPQECNLSDVLASKLACCSQEDSPHKNKNKTGVWS